MHGRRISVVGLGYVGLPVAVALSRQGPVVGFDISRARVDALKGGHDATNEVEPRALAAADIEFTCDPADLAGADFHIVAVPTPIDEATQPDLRPLLGASEMVGRQLKRGDIVVYESTVFPGATEDCCIPILERESGLVAGADFGVGYSPERINPGDKVHRFETITKVVSGQDAPTLAVVSAVYASVVDAGVFEAASIRAAEAAKVIENTQRDLNIAFMNELAVMFSKMGLDTSDVLAAARTKWNFLPFEPGLVGGHCIGVDPYYLTHKAMSLGMHPQVILAGRRINDEMGSFVARQVVKALLRSNAGGRPRVTVLGLSFKENVPDLRNTKVIDVIRSLEEHGIEVQVHDPEVDAREALEHYGVELCPLEALTPAPAIVLAVPHRSFVERGWPLVQGLLPDGKGYVYDVRSALDRVDCPTGIVHERL